MPKTWHQTGLDRKNFLTAFQGMRLHISGVCDKGNGSPSAIRHFTEATRYSLEFSKLCHIIIRKFGKISKQDVEIPVFCK